jgi:hypothetical protein
MWKKTWNDPVGSKLISVGLGTIIAFLATFIYSRFTDKSFEVVFEEIVFYKVQTDLYIVILVFFALLISQAIIKKLTKFFKDGKTEKVDPIRISNQLKIEDFINRNHIRKYSDGFTCRYITQKSKYDTLPFIHTMTFFCDLHDPPLKINSDRCPDTTCANNRRTINKHSEKNNIESAVLNDWYSINFK